MKVAVQTAIRVHHLRSSAAIRRVYRAGVPARTLCRDRRLGPHHRDRRPHAAVGRLLRGGRRGEGGAGRPQRHREVVVHLGPGRRAHPAAAPPGQRPAARLVRVPARRRPCPAGSGSSRPGSPTSSRPAGSTCSTTPSARRAGRMADDPTEENIELFTDLQEQFQANGGYEAESVMARLADGLGLRQELLLEDIDVALGRPATPGRPHACALPGARAHDPRRAHQPPRPFGQALAARRAGPLRRRAARGEPRPQAARPAITKVLHISNQRLTEWKGNYSKFEALHEADQSRRERASELEQREITRLSTLADSMRASTEKRAPQGQIARPARRAAGGRAHAGGQARAGQRVQAARPAALGGDPARGGQARRALRRATRCSRT